MYIFSLFSLMKLFYGERATLLGYLSVGLLFFPSKQRTKEFTLKGMRLKIPVVVFIVKTQIRRLSYECASGVPRGLIKAPFGFTCLNIYTNKYPNKLKLSESQYKHNTQEEECVLVID